MAVIFESLLLYAGVIAVCTLTAIYFYFKRSWTYWKKRNVPYVEPTFPFGNFSDIVLQRKSIGEVFKKLYDQLEGNKYAGTYMFTKAEFLFRDPEIIKNVLVKDFSNFHDRGFYINEEREPLTGHLFLLPGTKWRNLRVKLTPTFTSGKMKMMFQTLVDCGQELGECLTETANNEEVIEIKDVVARFSTDIISSCAFGIQCNCLKNPDAEFRQWGRKIFEPTINNSLFSLLSFTVPALVDFLKIRPLDKKVAKYFRNMVEETVNYREKNSFKRNDFIQLLIQIKNKGTVDADCKNGHQNGHTISEKTSDDNTMSMNCLAAQAFVFFLAGFETSSTTMQFCLYELTKNPDIQDRVRQEIDEILKKHDGKITYEAVQEMEYLDKVVSETLRKYPPVPILNRECTKTYHIPGTDIVLNEGDLTVIPVLGLHHDPKYYPNPERFDPERFSEEEKAKRHHYAYLPFGEGPRICIGMRFGLMQTKVGLISLLSRYQFCVSKETPIPLVMEPKSFVLSPIGGMHLQIKKRVK
ncbi:probable cytochrome P450 6a14 [Periplaneta americana]|uniref:probable cytochrome P450 6a14 n=1 Tax=Periplaneta americana TaxID=6978 RepID=UPI0037E7C855